MKPKLIIAVILIVLGVVAFVYQGITYTMQSEVVNIEQTHRIPLPPIFGAVALIGGIALLLLDERAPRPTTTP
jgi:drug/metabolite transporter (DMT)-like permease